MSTKQNQKLAFSVIDHNDAKIVTSSWYNYIYNKQNGFFVRWGQNKQDNPKFSPFGPELLDISITSKCFPGTCKYCYQNANKNGLELPLDHLDMLLSHMPKTVCQIALGGGEPTLHKDFDGILSVIRDKHGIVPNYTTNGYNLNENIIKATFQYCGAVATSYHGDWSVTLESVNKFSDAGMEQTNVHFILGEDTIDEAICLLQESSKEDFKNVHAVVFLLYKPQGRAPLSGVLQDMNKFRTFMDLTAKCEAFQVGFDSCSTPLLYHMSRTKEDIDMLDLLAEPCESSLFSYYIDVDLNAYPCSFCKGHVEPIKLSIHDESFDFMRDVWYHPTTNIFRRSNLESTTECKACKHQKMCRKCAVYPDITRCAVNGKQNQA